MIVESGDAPENVDALDAVHSAPGRRVVSLEEPMAISAILIGGEADAQRRPQSEVSGYQFNENMLLNMGYNLIYFDKIASSTRTLASVNTGVPPVFVTGPGFEDALYHGLTLDFTYKFLPN